MSEPTAIQITWRDRRVPMDTPIPARDILRTAALKRAVAHLAVERGGKHARSSASALVRRLARLARLVGQDGIVLTICTTNQTTAPPPWDTYHGLGVEVRAVRGDTIVWDIALMVSPGSSAWRLVREPGAYYRTTPVRADTFLRRIAAADAERRRERAAERERDAAAYVASLPDPLRGLQQTARATCIRVAADGAGVSITEALHDVGGSMTSVVGSNGYVLPDSLAEQQVGHDAVYHRNA